jgi:hypothetical protein
MGLLHICFDNINDIYFPVIVWRTLYICFRAVANQSRNSEFC